MCQVFSLHFATYLHCDPGAHFLHLRNVEYYEDETGGEGAKVLSVTKPLVARTVPVDFCVPGIIIYHIFFPSQKCP